MKLEDLLEIESDPYKVSTTGFSGRRAEGFKVSNIKVQGRKRPSTIGAPQSEFHVDSMPAPVGEALLYNWVLDFSHF